MALIADGADRSIIVNRLPNCKRSTDLSNGHGWIWVNSDILIITVLLSFGNSSRKSKNLHFTIFFKSSDWSAVRILYVITYKMQTDRADFQQINNYKQTVTESAGPTDGSAG